MESHTGHRERLRNRFRSEGLDHFEEKHALELLLFYCIPRKNTSELADTLLKYFGSIVAVLDATPEELERVPGVGKEVSTFLSLRKAMNRYYDLQSEKLDDGPVDTPAGFGRKLAPFFTNQRNEVVYVLCLDGKCKPLGCLFVGEGSVNSANVPIRRIVEICLNANATSVVLAHNHPSGLAMPSDEDVETTYRLAQAFCAVDIHFADHLIFADKDYTSLRQTGYYQAFQTV
jgi:DNA repair protein RadC